MLCVEAVSILNAAYAFEQQITCLWLFEKHRSINFLRSFSSFFDNVLHHRESSIFCPCEREREQIPFDVILGKMSEYYSTTGKQKAAGEAGKRNLFNA